MRKTLALLFLMLTMPLAAAAQQTFPGMAANNNMTGQNTLAGVKIEWSGVRTYQAQQIVSYMGSLYQSIAGGNLNHAPTDTMYWTQITSFSGDAGADIEVQYLIQNCTGITNCVEIDLGTKVAFNATYVAGSTTIVTDMADPSFSPSDVGKAAFGSYNCGDATASPCFNNVPLGTITAYVNAHQVTVSVAAVNNSNTMVESEPFIWGTIQTDEINEAVDAMFTTPSAPHKLVVGCGAVMFDASIFQLPFHAFHIDIEAPCTTFIPTPLFTCDNPRGTAQNGCLFSGAYAVPVGGDEVVINNHFTVHFWGGGSDRFQAGSTVAAEAVAGIFIGIFDVCENCSVQGWARQDPEHLAGIYSAGGTMIGSGSYGAGWDGCWLRGQSLAPGVMFGGTCGGNGNGGSDVRIDGGGVASSGKVSTHGVYFNDNMRMIVAGAGTQWTDHGSYLAASFSISGGATARLFGSKIASNTLENTGGEVHFSGVTLNDPGGPWLTMSAGSFHDDCGTTFPTGASSASISGTGVWFGACSVTGEALSTSDWVLDADWGGVATAVATDNFNRANGSPGANWTGGLGASPSSELLISSNQVTGNGGAGTFSEEFWTGAGTFSDDQYSKLTLSTAGTSGHGIGVAVRMSSAGSQPTGYLLTAFPGNSKFTLHKVIAGVYTLIQDGITPAPIAGDVMELQIFANTLIAFHIRSGTTTTLYSGTVSDGITTGKPGIVGYDDGSSLGDTWEGGSLGATVSSCSGSTRRQQCTITVIGTPMADPTLTVTFPTPFQVAPICRAWQVGGTNQLNDWITGAVTKTTAAFTYLTTPTTGTTVQTQVECELP